ncbi:MAG: carboxypeptidase regulatory-like domain-containing protein [Archaeoglobus sp.]|nr:carboxypeptidase regulatory-like domain-containing protein [Archaeoglobus sp.]
MIGTKIGKIRGVGFLTVLVLVASLLVGSVESDIKGVNAVPGETVTFNLVVTNDRSYERNFQLSYTAPEGFVGKFIYNGKEIETLTLKANESKSIQFQLEIPHNAKEKEYYVFVQAAGSLALRINVKMPEKPLEITPSITGVAIEAGDTVSFPILIKNKLNAEYAVSLSCKLPENWSYRFIEGGVEIYRIILKPNEERSVSLEIESDSSSDVKEYEVVPYFNNQFTKLSVKITKTHKGENGKIRLKVVSKEGEPIASAMIAVTHVTSSEFGSMSSEVRFFTSADGSVTIEISPETYTVKISKEGFYDKEIKDVGVKAGKTTDLGTVVLDKKPYYAKLSVENPKISFVIGSGNPVFRLRLDNVGYADDTYKLSVVGLPENFYYKFKESEQSTEGISEVYIKSGESKNVYLEVLIPPNAETGTYNLTLFVDGHYSTKRNLTLVLRGEYKVFFESLRGYVVTTEAGKMAEFRGILRNVGGVALTNLNFSVNAPSRWRVSVSPSSLPVLEAKDSIPVRVAIQIPPDALPSEYKLTLSIKSDQVNQEERFRVIVKERSNAALLGGVIIVGALIGLFIIFRKFGRR